MNELPANYDNWKSNPREYVDRPDADEGLGEGPMQYREWLNARATALLLRRPATVANCDWCRSPIVDGEPHATFVGFETLVMHRRCVVEWMDQ
jgi:hypothetical protein